MRPFATLRHAGQVPRLRRLAGAALGQYGVSPARVELLSHRANTMFRVTPREPGRGRLILRVYGPSPPPVAMIESELAWLVALRREIGARVPEPVPTQAGALLTTATAPGVPGSRFCVLFKEVAGRFVDAGLRPLHLNAVGRLMADLHRQALWFRPPPGFTRPRWDWRAQFGPGRVFAPGRSAGVLTPRAEALFAAAGERIAAGLAALPERRGTFGLIHADLQQTNYLFHRGVAHAIDFEDCCWHYFLFDMTVTLFELTGRPDAAAMRDAFFTGYSDVHPLPPDHEAGIRLFTAIRLGKRINYLAHAPDPALRAQAPAWVARAVPWLEAFLAE
ncbi:MAG TPA: phosphotransferase [Chloroflexia bacterium]|nr:phosphotransferase [Chloroflexia bacterium]